MLPLRGFSSLVYGREKPNKLPKEKKEKCTPKKKAAPYLSMD